MKYTSNSVTEEHLIWFGTIIHIFAKCESRMRIAISGILNIDMGSTLILTGELQYQRLRQTLKHLNNTRGVNGYIVEDINDALDALHKFSKIRNWIAHSTWKTGKRPDSIKPMQLIIRGEEPRPLGGHHNEKDYTPDDLQDIALGLESVSLKLTEAMESSGLFEIVEETMDETSDANSARDGSPNSK